MKKYLFLIIFILTSGVKSHCQTVELPHDQLALHLSKGCFFSGDIVWFKMYNLNTDKQKLSNSSELGFIELINTANHSIIRQKIKLENGVGYGDIKLPDSLSTNHYTLIYYTNLIKNFGEKAFCKTQIAVINPNFQIEQEKDTTRNITSVPKIFNDSEIELNKTRFSFREKIDINILRSGSLSEIENYSVSISLKEPSVFQKNTWQLGTKTKGIPEFKFYPDYKGVVFSGKLANIQEKPLPNTTIFVSPPDKKVELYYDKTDKAGQFRVLIPTQTGNKDLILTTPEECNISLDEVFWNGLRSNSHVSLPLKLTIENQSFLKKQFIYHQLVRKFKFKKRLLTSGQQPKRKGVSFYGQPHQYLKLDQFVELDSIPEYFYELIPTVQFIKRKKNYLFRASHPIFRTFLKGKPAVFIDGVYYSNFNNIAKLNHKQVESIEVIPEEYYYQTLKFNGIVSIFTRSGNFNSLPMLPNATRISYPISESPSLFLHPNYTEKSDSQLPDLRTTLLWKPDVKILKGQDKTNIHLYSSDIEGQYVITVCGVNADGKFVIKQKEITVVNKQNNKL